MPTPNIRAVKRRTQESGNLEFSQEDIQTLVDLGLTFVQAKIFLVLIQTGSMKAGTISKVTKISRADVYRTLERLQENGLIEKQIAKPALFSSIPTKDALNILIQRQSLKQIVLEDKATGLLKKFKKKDFSFSNQFKFVFVPSKEALIKKLNKAISNTEKTIDVSTSWKRLSSAGFSLAENLKKAWDRGVKGRVVIDINRSFESKSIKDFWYSPNAEIRYIPKIPKTVMAIYDKKEVFVFVNPLAQLTDSPSLWSNVPSLVDMANDYFDILWSTAMESSNYNLDDTED